MTETSHDPSGAQAERAGRVMADWKHRAEAAEAELKHARQTLRLLYDVFAGHLNPGVSGGFKDDSQRVNWALEILSSSQPAQEPR